MKTKKLPDKFYKKTVIKNLELLGSRSEMLKNKIETTEI